MILVHPPLLSSAWQFEHQGAHKCTTVRSGVLIAPMTFCSAGDSARSEAAASSTTNIGNRTLHMLFPKHKGETLNAQRQACNTVTHAVVSGCGKYDPA